MSRKHISPIPKQQQEPLTIRQRARYGAGLKALGVATKHIWEEMGLHKAYKIFSKLNKDKGIDCPGCAWPDPENRSSLGEYCENGVKAIAEESTAKKVDPDFFAAHSIEELSTWTDFELGKSGRISQPVILKEGSSHYEAIAWEEAFQTISRQLRALSDPDEAIFYTSGRTSNEAAFLYQLFVRQFGTNNLPDCSNMCHESSGVALSKTVGIGKGSVRLEDFYEAELIIVMGQNPGTNHPRMLSALELAKQRGARIIAVNPIPEAGMEAFRNPQKVKGIIGKGTALTDLFLQLTINQDLSLLKAWLKILKERSKTETHIIDQEFIANSCSGFDSFWESLEEYDLDSLIKATAIPASLVYEAAEMIANSHKIIICWAMGLTQHQNGVATIQEAVNLLLLKGSIGKAGAGTCPVRGHSNVQGDRTMGIWEKPKPAFLDKLESVCQFQAPRKNGLNTVEAIEAMYHRKAKVFMAMGGNFLSATPDTYYTAEALQQCDMTIQVSTKLNRSHLICGKTAIILPCLGRTEKDLQQSGYQFVTVENSMGRVHSSQGTLKPSSPHLKSEVSIICELATTFFGKKTHTDWASLQQNYDQIRDLIERVVPGFENYNQKVREKNGFDLPNGARERKFNTSDGKAQFTSNPPALLQLKENEFIMMTIRSHDQFNTTIYGQDDRYRGVFGGRKVVFMNERDMRDHGFEQGQEVELKSLYHGKERKVEGFKVIPYDIAPSCIATYFPEANPLIAIDHIAEHSHTPASKSVLVTIEKHQA